MESLKHSHKLETANVKLECARSRGELERERDTLQGQVDGTALCLTLLQTLHNKPHPFNLVTFHVVMSR